MLSSQAQVAKLCRQYLKSIGVKGSCTSESFAGGTAVRVEINDVNPTLDIQIHKELGQYQYGKFDGMTDCYDYTNSRDDIPQTKYLTISNRFTLELKQKAWDFIRANISEASNMPETYDYSILSSYRIANECVDQYVFRFLNSGSVNNELPMEFWATVDAPKPIKMKTDTDAPESIEVTEGTKVGYVEIRFPAKPDNTARTALKKSGFRWSPRNTCWWGKADRLPESYA